jgi:hypothetical protein
VALGATRTVTSDGKSTSGRRRMMQIKVATNKRLAVAKKNGPKFKDKRRLSILARAL